MTISVYTRSRTKQTEKFYNIKIWAKSHKITLSITLDKKESNTNNLCSRTSLHIWRIYYNIPYNQFLTYLYLLEVDDNKIGIIQLCRKAWQTIKQSQGMTDYEEAIQQPYLSKPSVSGQLQPRRSPSSRQWPRNYANIA